MIRNDLFALFIMLIIGLQSQAHAAIMVFDDKTAFLSMTGANATDPLPNVGLVPPGGATASLTVGELTFTITPPSSQLYCGTQGTGLDPDPWTNRLSGNQMAISDVENLNVDLATSVFSIGFDFVEPENDPNLGATFFDSTFTVTLLKDGMIVDSFTFNAPNDTASFVGVWSDSSFNRIEIREIIGGKGNEFFGQFYQGLTPFLDCEGDFDGDGDVDGTDLATFAVDFGRTDCDGGLPCEGNFDGDGDVDGSDLATFAADFGRTDCLQ